MAIQKRILVIVFFISLFLSTSVTRAQGINAYFYASPFYATGYGIYIETYITIDGNSVNYTLNEDNRLQASVQVTMAFKNADEIQEYRKYKIVSMAFQDSIYNHPDFTDLQRILIPEGVYNFDLILHDNIGPDTLPDYKSSQLISVNLPKNEIALSGIQFLERFTETENENIYVKNGYECIPYTSNVFPKESKYLRFYLELYNAAKELEPLDDFNFKVTIEHINTHKPIKEFTSFTQQKAMNLNVLLKEIDIRKLSSGNYFLTIDVLDRNNKSVIKESRFFQHNNPDVKANPAIDLKTVNISNTFIDQFSDVDSLRKAVKFLQPIADQAENSFIKDKTASADLVTLQQFFFCFWSARNQRQPQEEWNHYLNELKYVQDNFSTNNEQGFETDRGKIYLQFGAPDAITFENSDPDNYPYTIWHYFTIADQANRKFLFYNPTSMSNDFKLLHSNMINVATNVPWQNALYLKGEKGNADCNAKRIFEGK